MIHGFLKGHSKRISNRKKFKMRCIFHHKNVFTTVTNLQVFAKGRNILKKPIKLSPLCIYIIYIYRKFQNVKNIIGHWHPKKNDLNKIIFKKTELEI